MSDFTNVFTPKPQPTPEEQANQAAQAAQQAAENTAPSIPPPYQPTFQQGVTVLLPQGQTAAVNPLYCATEQTAKDLLALLKIPATITHLPPSGPGFSFMVIGTQDPNGVPFYSFSNGALCNVGLDVASYFTHGWSQSTAERMANLDIANLEAGN